MDPVLLSKVFKYEGVDELKGVNIQGGVYYDSENIYLFHDKFDKPSMIANQFGLLGLLIKWLMTKNDIYEPPFEGVLLSEIDPDVLVRFNIKKFSERAQMVTIPKDEMRSLSKSLLGGVNFLVEDIKVIALGYKGKAAKEMPIHGYEFST